MEAMAHKEIDVLPFLKMGGSFHGELLVITRWFFIWPPFFSGGHGSIGPWSPESWTVESVGSVTAWPEPKEAGIDQGSASSGFGETTGPLEGAHGEVQQDSVGG